MSTFKGLSADVPVVARVLSFNVVCLHVERVCVAKVSNAVNSQVMLDQERVISYVEEFRMQAERDEEVYVEGNLEQVVSSRKTFHQITLTYGPRYYEQALKVLKS